MLEHPSQYINDVAVAGVKGERLSDELVPRAWIVLSSLGKQQGAEAVFAALDEWTRSRLSKHKWLRGGFQIIDEVGKNGTFLCAALNDGRGDMSDTEVSSWKGIAQELAGRVRAQRCTGKVVIQQETCCSKRNSYLDAVIHTQEECTHMSQIGLCS